jgi:hypothetical protein
MICHHKKCVFVHIPKTAGQSIEYVFLNLLDLTWETRAPLLLRRNDRPELGPPRLAHLKASEYVRYKYMSQELFDEYYKFSFVRNPWDRLISIYKHFGFHYRYEFKTFLMKKFKDTMWLNKSWFVGPQSDFVRKEDGSLIVDFIGKFENLQNDFDHVCQQIGLQPTKLPYVNRSKTEANPSLHLKGFTTYVWWLLRGKHLQGFKRYQDYYDNESKELVAQLYKQDVELFGYEFDRDASQNA